MLHGMVFVAVLKIALFFGSSAIGGIDLLWWIRR